MSETRAKDVEQRPANLAALEQGLREMAARVKRSDLTAKDRSRNLQEPMLIIRGK